MTVSSDRFFERRANIKASRKPGASIKLVPNSEDVQALLNSKQDGARANFIFEQMNTGRTVYSDVCSIDPAEIASLRSIARESFNRGRFNDFVGAIWDTTVRSVAGPLGVSYLVSGLKTFDDERPGPTTPHYQPGKPGLPAFLLSAPGNAEKRAGHPAAGRTGEELQAFITTQHALNPKKFSSPHLRDYPITNAAMPIHSKKETDSTEAKNNTIRDPKTIRRIKREIGAKKTIVALGKKPNLALDMIESPAATMRNSHPSPQAMNTKFKPERKGTPPEQRADRSAQWGKKTVDSLQREEPSVIRRAGSQVTFAFEDSVKSGKQQIISEILGEFTIAVSKEIVDCFRNGIRAEGENIFVSLMNRIKRILAHVLNRWKSIIEVGFYGIVSGFLTGLADIFISMIANMAKRFVRLIRQGLLSILNAIRLVLAPPPNSDPAQIWHEASKILTGGVIVSGGIILEEMIAKTFPGMDLISAMGVAIVTGLMTAISMYALDHFDLFNAIEDQRHRFVLSEFTNRIEKSMKSVEKAVEIFALPGMPDEV